jgi:ABC-2 type transport system permease protein
MTAASNAVPMPAGSQAVSTTRLLYCSIRRELWEHPSLYIAPLAAGAVFLIAFLFHLFRLPNQMRATSALDPMHQRAALEQPYMMAVGLLMLTGMLVGAVYSLDALHGERRDRSILFWKSMPVSDLTVVLSKAAIPIIVLQLIAFAVAAAVMWIMFFLSSAVLLASGTGVAQFWSLLPIVQMSFLLLYHLVILHGLWHAPFYGWMLMVSSWARRAPFLWAVLPPLAIAIVEKLVFNTSHLAGMLLHHLGGSPDSGPKSGDLMDMLGHFEPGMLLSESGLWTGLAATAVFLAVAVRLRRDREPA